MARKIRWTKRADKKFEDILLYLNEEFGESSVEKFIERTYTFLDVLKNFPQIGTLEDKEKGIYGFVLEKPVSVFYRFTEKEVVLLNFFGNRRSPNNRTS